MSKMLPLANSLEELRRLVESGALDKRDILERKDYLDNNENYTSREYAQLLEILIEKKGDTGW